MDFLDCLPYRVQLKINCERNLHKFAFTARTERMLSSNSCIKCDGKILCYSEVTIGALVNYYYSFYCSYGFFSKL